MINWLLLQQNKPTLKRILLLTIAAVMLVSCSENKGRITRENTPVVQKPEPVHDPFENKKWQAELEKDKGKLKAGWLSWWNPYSYENDEHMEAFM